MIRAGEMQNSAFGEDKRKKNPSPKPPTRTREPDHDYSDEYRALRRKYLLLEEDSFALDRELKQAEDEVKALALDKFELLDKLVVMEGSKILPLPVAGLEGFCDNFADGTKQDAIDLLQGHYIVAVSRDMAPVPQKGGLEAIANFPVALLVVLISFWFATMSLKQAGTDYKHKHLLFSVLWAGISVGVAALVRANGRIFCNRPRLHKPRS